MDIQTKDGILLRNIPDGTPDEEIKARINKIRAGGAEQPKGGDLSKPTDALRNAALAGRAAFEGVTALPILAGDVLSGGMARRMMGSPEPSLQDRLKQLLDSAGAYSPETANERLATDAIQGATGALAGPGKGIVNAAKALTVGGSAGLAGGTAREEGASPLVQILASLAGGTAVQGLGAGANALGRGARNVIEPIFAPEKTAARLASNVAGTKRDEVIAALQQAQSGVPNLKLNAGQASVPSGSAEFAALQKLVNEAKPTPAAALESSQEAARRSAIQSIGKDKPTLEAAIGKRAGDAKANYGAAGNELIKSDADLTGLMNRPSMDKALSRAAELAKEKGETLVVGKDLPERTVSSAILGANGKPAMETTLPAEFAKYPVKTIHYVKLSLDDMLKNPERFGIGATEASAIGQTRKQLIEWLGNKSPKYDAARTEFSKASKPINQMQVGQYLEEKLVGPLENGDRAGMFAGAMRDAPRTIKGSTGQSIYDDLGQVLTPQQKQVAEAVLGNLKNDAAYNDLATKGMSATRKLVGDFGDPIPQPQLLNRIATVANAIIRRVEGKGSKATMNALADLSNDPARMADLMKKATPTERKSLIEALAQSGAATIGQQP